MSNNGKRAARNLSENLPWTCDLRMAKDPNDTNAFFLDHNHKNTRLHQEWGVAIDHCWVVDNKKSLSTSNARVVSLQASDHLGLAIEISR